MKTGKTKEEEQVNGIHIDELGDAHHATSAGTPIVDTAFDTTDQDKIEAIEHHFRKIMETLGLDLSDDSLSGTPRRVAKMYVKEIFQGLNPANKPLVTSFKNNFRYSEMLVEKDISVFSTCEHHFLPIIGKAHVAYIPNGKVVGLSKLNRIVDYYSRRPSVQERLTIQIADELQSSLNTQNVAVVIEAKHFCVISRGIEDINSTTLTAEYRGKFEDEAVKKEFQQYITMKLMV